MINEKIDTEIFKEIQYVADKYFDGHFTLMKFTNNWRLSFGSDVQCECDGDAIKTMPDGNTLDKAVIKALKEADPGDPRTALNRIISGIEKRYNPSKY